MNDVVIKFNKLPELAKKMPNKVADGIEAAAREGETYVKRSIQDSPATGQTYGTHTASSPGNPPRTDTSNLVNSINPRKISKFVWAIQVGAEYGKILEYGGRFVAARPFMGPMAIWLEGRLDDIIMEFIENTG